MDKDKETHIKETPLFEIDLRSKYGLEHTYIKDESHNPFGTIKDRKNLYIFQEASRLQVDKLVLITSGNNGYSLAQLAKGSSIKVVCVVSRSLPDHVKLKLKEVAYQVIEINLDHKILRPEELIAFAREKEDEVIWDVTNGYEENYSTVFNEIVRKVTPDYIVVPIGSGGIYLGIIESLERYNSRTRVIGVGVESITRSFADKLSTPWTPYAKALEKYQSLGHPIYRLTEEEVKETFNSFKNVVNCEPSSSIIFAAIKKHPFKTTDNIVFLNSGKALIL